MKGRGGQGRFNSPTSRGIHGRMHLHCGAHHARKRAKEQENLATEDWKEGCRSRGGLHRGKNWEEC